MEINEKNIYAVPEISIIMPLFNAENYMKESLISISNQTFVNFELICIDDASTDSTFDVLKEYQQKDARIKLLCNEKRSGAAFSRNRGMGQALGKYLIFLDSDDIFDKHMLEESYKCAENKNVDMVIFEYKHVPSEKIYEKAVKIHGKEYIEKYCKDVFRVETLKSYEMLILTTSPCNKLLRKNFITSNQIKFQSLPSSNDVYFIYMAYFLAEKIIVLNDSRVFLYARDHQVNTRISSNRNPICVYFAMEELQKELLRRNLFRKFYQNFYCLCYWSFLNTLKKTKKLEEKKDYYDFLQSKGIQRLYDRAIDCFDKIDKDIINRLINFETCEFKTFWFLEDDIFSFYLEKNAERIKEIFSTWKKQKKLVGIWGAGRNGQLFLKYCNLHEFQIAAVIDTDPSKNGRVIAGYCIQLPESVLPHIQAIITIPQFIKEDVRRKIGKRQIIIVDINEFLCLV